MLRAVKAGLLVIPGVSDVPLVLQLWILSGETVNGASSGGQFEELVDELNLTPDNFPVNPTSLPLPDHVHGFVTLSRSPGRPEFSKPLLGVHAPFDRAVILLRNVVLVLHRSMPEWRRKTPSFLMSGIAEL